MTTNPEPFRIQISLTDTQVSEKEIQEIASIYGKPELSKVSYKHYESNSGIRRKVLNDLKMLMIRALKDVAAGNVAGAYELSSEPEPFFDSARTKVKTDKDGNPVEHLSQADAIRELFRIPPGAPLTISEADLVKTALKIGKEQSRAKEYNFNELVREGLRMVCQSIISKQIATNNAVEGSKSDRFFATRGASDARYRKALDELYQERADPALWKGRRSNRITVSMWAKKAGTNDYQIRDYIKRHNITGIHDPQNPAD